MAIDSLLITWLCPSYILLSFYNLTCSKGVTALPPTPTDVKLTFALGVFRTEPWPCARDRLVERGGASSLVGLDVEVIVFLALVLLEREFCFEGIRRDSGY